MTRLVAALIVLLLGITCPIAAAQATDSQSGIFTGIHRNHKGWGKPETVTITDGKSYMVLSEQDYRAGGYWPPYEKLPTIIVQRLPVRIPVPSEEELRKH
jgi:hypothetical protein